MWLRDLPIWEFMLLCYRTACFFTIACDCAKRHNRKKTLSLVYFKSNICLRVHIKFHPLKTYFTKTFAVTWCYLTHEWQLLYYFTLQVFLKNTLVYFLIGFWPCLILSFSCYVSLHAINTPWSMAIWSDKQEDMLWFFNVQLLAYSILVS